MANSQYSGDSPFPPPISVQPGMSGGPEIIAAKPACVPAMPAIALPLMPAPYVLSGGTAMYTGESAGYARRLLDHGAADATPRPDPVAPFPTPTID